MKVLIGFNATTAAAYAVAQGWTLTGYDGAGHPRFATASGEPVVFSQGAFVGETTSLAGLAPSEVIYGQLPVETDVNAIVQASATKLTVATVSNAVPSTAATKKPAPTSPNLKT